MVYTLCACTSCEKTSNLSNATDVSFFTIVNSKYAYSDCPRDQEAKVMVFTDMTSIKNHPYLLSEQTNSHLETSDFSENILLVASQGRQNSGSYGITITSIQLNDNQVYVFADIILPTPEQGDDAVITYPFHLVELKRDFFTGKEFKVNLVIQECIVDTYVFITE